MMFELEIITCGDSCSSPGSSRMPAKAGWGAFSGSAISESGNRGLGRVAAGLMWGDDLGM